MLNFKYLEVDLIWGIWKVLFYNLSLSLNFEYYAIGVADIFWCPLPFFDNYKVKFCFLENSNIRVKHKFLGKIGVRGPITEFLRVV